MGWGPLRSSSRRPGLPTAQDRSIGGIAVGQSTTSVQRKKRNIRFHDGEWDRVERRARACGLPPATYVRKAALGVKLRARRNRTENELILHLGRIGMDLQRLIRSPHQTDKEAGHPDLQEVLEEVLAAVRRIG